MMAALALVVACGGGGPPAGPGGDGGAGNHTSTGGSGGGSGGSGASGGGATQCNAIVDGAVVGTGQGHDPAILRIETGYAVAAVRGGEAWLTLVDDEATVLSHHAVSSAAGLARLPTIHAVGDRLAVLWAEGGNVMMRSADAGGTPVDAPVLLAATTSTEPRPAGASMGATLGVAFMDGVGATAGVVDGSGMQQTTPVPGWFPAVAAYGGNMGVAWSEGAAAGPVKVAPFDAMNAPATVQASSSLIKTLLASSEGYFVAWEDVGGSAEQIGLAKVVAGEVVKVVSGAESGYSANWPALAFDGARLTLVYYQFRDGPPSVYLTYFDPDLGASGVDFEVADHAKYPSIAQGDEQVAVVYAVENGPIELSIVRCP